MKGAECRRLVAFGFQLAQEMHEKLQTPHSNTVLQCMVHLYDFYICMHLYLYISTDLYGEKHTDVEEVHLYDFYMLIAAPDFNAALAKEACMGFCTMFSALSREAEREGKQLWVMKPKMHMFQELNQRTTLTDDKTS